MLVTGISPLATDAYLPALPALQRSLYAIAACRISAVVPDSRVHLAGTGGRTAIGRHRAALSGGIVFLAGALVTPLTGVLGYSTLRPMALLMSAFFAASALALAAARRPKPRRGRP